MEEAYKIRSAGSCLWNGGDDGGHLDETSLEMDWAPSTYGMQPVTEATSLWRISEEETKSWN